MLEGRLDTAVEGKRRGKREGGGAGGSAGWLADARVDVE